MIDILCKCGNQGQVPESYAGQRIRCDTCQRPVRVPGAAPEGTAPGADSSIDLVPEETAPENNARAVHLQAGPSTRRFRDADREGHIPFGQEAATTSEGGLLSVLSGIGWVIVVGVVIFLDLLLEWL